MSTQQQINIQITVNGANPAARAIAGVGEAGRRAHTSIFNLRNLLLGFTVKSIVAELTKFSDKATQIDNKLNSLTGSVARSNELFEALYKTANDTRSSLESTVQGYTRLERSTVGLNLTTQQLLDLTKGINQSFQIFGNTSKEADAALIQFSQGLSVGVLRGDELRSVLEQSPRLAKAIADGLNEIPEGKAIAEKFGTLFRDFQSGAITSEVLAGGLRKLGAAGALSSELITKGLLTQLPKLQEEFLRTKPTIENAFTLLENKLIKMARSDDFKKFSLEIGKAIVDLVDHLDEIFEAIAPIGVVLIKMIPLVYSLLSAFGEFAGSVIDGFMSIFSAAVIAFGGVSNTGHSAAGELAAFFVGAFKTIYEAFKTLTDLLVRGAAAIGGFFGGTIRSIAGAFIVAFDSIKGAAQDLTNFLIDGLNVFKSEADKIKHVDFFEDGKIETNITNPLDDAKQAADRMSLAVDQVFGPLDKFVDKSGAALVKFGDDATAAVAELKKLGDTAKGLSTLNTIPGGKERVAVDNPLNANDQRKFDSFTQRMEDLRDGTDDARDGLRELERAVKQYNTLTNNPEIAKRLPAQIAFETEIAKLRKEFSDQAVDQLVAEHKALGEAAQSSLDHYKAQRLLTQALKDGIPPSQEQIDQLALTLKGEREIVDAQKERDNILESLTRKAEQYRAVLAATNELEASKSISSAEGDRRVKATEVGQGVEAAKDFVAEQSLDPNDKLNRELEVLTDERAQRLDFIATAQAEDLENVAEYEQLRLDTIAAYAKKETDIRLAAQELQYANAANNFGDLAELSKGFVKESSGIYKTLFAISKGFAIADGIVKVQQAIINASASLPFPANLAAMAQVGASGLALLATIKSAVAPDVALADGGPVVGPGGPRDDAVNAALSNGEYVINAEDTGKNRALLDLINSGKYNAGQGGGTTVNLTQNINGLQDKEGFRASGRQVADDTARALNRAQARN